LQGYTDGSGFRWAPASSLLNSTSLTPSAFPLETTTYTLLGYDTLGCPKPGMAQVTITVRPEIHAFAGNDTAIVKGQPLQLQGSGSDYFSWSPERGLDLTSVSNPLSSPDQSITYVMRT